MTMLNVDWLAFMRAIAKSRMRTHQDLRGYMRHAYNEGYQYQFRYY
jgi:hypothetical protein